MEKKTIGIVGGMGPLATADLLKKIVEITDAPCDQEHVHVYVDNNTNIPDRTAAILHGGKDPVPEMVKSAIRLQAMGADALIVPCNTAHYFLPQVKQYVDIPFLNMLEETAALAKQRGMGKVGLMATDGTVQSGVYRKAFETTGIKMVIPGEKGQKGIMDVIYKGVKAGDCTIDLTDFHGAMDELFAKGAEALILGCTELPLAFEMFHINRPFIDPTLTLAKAAVVCSGASLKKEYR